jgi:hypothetical protein
MRPCGASLSQRSDRPEGVGFSAIPRWLPRFPARCQLQSARGQLHCRRTEARALSKIHMLRLITTYCMRKINQPISVAGYKLSESLPADLQTSLPSIEAIEQALADPDGSAPMP